MSLDKHFSCVGRIGEAISKILKKTKTTLQDLDIM